MAATVPTPGCIANINDPQIQELGCIIGNVITALLYAAFGVALIFVLRAAIKLISVQGDPKELQQAKGQLTWAILGMLVVVGALSMINILGGILGISNLSTIHFSIPTP